MWDIEIIKETNEGYIVQNICGDTHFLTHKDIYVYYNSKSIRNPEQYEKYIEDTKNKFNFLSKYINISNTFDVNKMYEMQNINITLKSLKQLSLIDLEFIVDNIYGKYDYNIKKTDKSYLISFEFKEPINIDLIFNKIIINDNKINDTKKNVIEAYLIFNKFVVNNTHYTFNQLLEKNWFKLKP
jgi:hypothetical protein